MNLAAPVAPALLLFLMLGLTGCGGGSDSGERRSSAATETFENPVFDVNFPDPFVLRSGDTYHAYSTNDAEANVPTLLSGDLVEWKKGETPCQSSPPG